MPDFTFEHAKAPANRFRDAETVESLIHQVIGAGSMCWVQRPKGEFDSTRALEVGQDALARLRQIQDELVTCISCEDEFPKISAHQIVVAGEVKSPLCLGCLDTIKTLSRFNRG